MFNGKLDALTTLMIVSLVGLALFQARELAVKKFGAGEQPVASAVAVERAPEQRPDSHPPRVAGKSAHRFAQRASAVEAND